MFAARVTSCSLFVLLTASAAVAQDEPGYPIRDFLGVTTYPEVAVSPNGRHIAVVTHSDDFEKNRPNIAIWRFDLDERGRVTGRLRLTSSPGTYSGLRWSPDSRALAFLRATPPDFKPHLLVLEMRGGEPRAISDEKVHGEGVSAYDWSSNGGVLIFAATDAPDEEERKAHEEFYGDVIRYAEQQPRTSLWRAMAADAKADPERLTTLAMQVQELAVAPSGTEVALLSGAPAKPEPFMNSFAQVEVHSMPLDRSSEPRQLTANFVSERGLSWTRAGDALYAAGVGDPAAQRTAWTQGRLFRIDLEGGVTVVAPDFPGELAAPFGWGAYASLPDGRLLAAANISTRTNLHAIDPRSGRAEPLTDYTGDVSSPSVSRDGSVVAFVLSTSSSFPEVYLSRGLANVGSAQPLSDFNARLTAMPVPAIETVRWSNGEGDEIEGVLYWPPGQRGAGNLPLVVDIHGGPWGSRTELITFNAPYVFAYYPALLASRGYLVLEPNYRGGAGRGEEFLHAIEGYSCSRPATDVLAGVDYVVDQGWADPDRMAVMGYSYGGLMTNCLITRTPRFRAAASGAGIWNDISYFGTADNFIQNDVRNHGAAPWENLESYWEESAISRAGDITTPTLVTIGGADRRVPTSQGHELYRALVRLGVPAELLVFPGEPHGFQQPGHKLTKVRAEIRWIDHYLLGKERPVFE